MGLMQKHYHHFLPITWYERSWYQRKSPEKWYTDLILNEILSGARESGIPTERIFLRDYAISPCIGCEKCRKDLTCTQFHDGMTLLYPKVEEAECLVLGSPVYNYNVTSFMKSFIDRLSLL